MRLADVNPAAPATAAELEITGLAYDNRAVRPGTLFFCVPGFTRDGHDFAAEAIGKGAVALVVQRPLNAGVPEIQVESVRAAMAPAAARFYGDPTARLQTVGVTGTNGKTTTAFLVRALLEAGGRRTGLLGTVKSVIGGVEHEVVRTTPEAIDLQRTFTQMLDGGDTAAVMEVSSHALELHRADAIHFAAAIFTNLTQDHLDFHGTMEEYFAAKRKLFTELRPRHAVINIDDPYGARLAGELADAITIALDDPAAAYRATDVQTAVAGSRFTVRTPDGPVALSSPLRGRFNVYNVLGALAAARALDVRRGDGGGGDRRPRARCPGASRPSTRARTFAVVVDYAHTPDSLENVLNARPEPHRPAAARRVRGGRRSRPWQAAADGRDRLPACRPGDRHLGQPAL